MARLYADENFPLPVVHELRRLDHDLLTVQETGRADQQFTDEEVLDFACADGRAVITMNRMHFIKLHSRRSEHSGIIVCTYDADFSRQAQRIHETINGVSLVNRLLRVNRPDR